MRMQKILALLAALAILFSLSSCSRFTKNPDDATTTTAASPLDPATPDTPPAAAPPMAPLQGGPMLYTFYGREAYTSRIGMESGEEYPVYPIGLIDQDGKLVSAPVYHNVEYIYDEAGQRVIGLAAVRNREITIYELDGASRVLPVEGYRIEAYPGGRYATVYTAEGMEWHGESYAGDPKRDGIYDLKNDKFAVEPKDGQMLNYKRGGVVMGYQYEGEALENQTAQWAFFCADESILDLPMALRRIQDYYPETGWFGGIWMERPGWDWPSYGYESRVYDENLNVIKSLSGWSIDYEGFKGGNWCMIYNNNAFPGVSTWVNREGEISQQAYESIYSVGSCFLAGNIASWQDKKGVLLDAELNVLCKSQPGERFVVLWRPPFGETKDGILLLDSDGKVKDSYGPDGKPLDMSGFRYWSDMDAGVDGMYATLNGQLIALDLTQFYPEPKQGHEGGERYARAIAACEDYIVIETGVHWYEGGPAVYDTFAIDWQGNRLDSCPLAPFFGLLTYQTAGDQGPGYFWIEREDGKRGYINTKGEWLFIDPTEYNEPT